jgi:hypothetical protein
MINFVTRKVGAKHEHLFTQPSSEVSLEHLCQTQVAHQSVTKIITVVIINLVTPKAGTEHELWFKKSALDF